MDVIPICEQPIVDLWALPLLLLLRSSCRDDLWALTLLPRFSCSADLWALTLLQRSSCSADLWALTLLLRSSCSADLWALTLLLRSCRDDLWALTLLPRSSCSLAWDAFRFPVAVETWLKEYKYLFSFVKQYCGACHWVFWPVLSPGYWLWSSTIKSEKVIFILLENEIFLKSQGHIWNKNLKNLL